MPTPLRLATFNVENLDDKPDQRPPLATRLTALRPQLTRLRADVLCLQEIHGQETPAQPRDLLALRQLIAGTAYENFHVATTRTQQGQVFDERNLVVLSRFPVLGTAQIKHQRAPAPAYRRVTANPPDAAARDVTWERPVLHVRLDLGAGRVLHVMNLHLKSKLPESIPGQSANRFAWKSAAGWAEGSFLASMKRVGQALETRILVDEIFDATPDALIAICGDLNAESDSVPVHALRGRVEDTGNPALASRVLVPCEDSVPLSSRYSLFHHGAGFMLDHVLVSRALLAFYRGTEIHNEVLPDESGAFRDDTHFPESDHAPVVAEFELP
ncbi:MAG: endonuclease/exonuclease/phosphatase family protein [Limisphaerales bacterium]